MQELSSLHFIRPRKGGERSSGEREAARLQMELQTKLTSKDRRIKTTLPLLHLHSHPPFARRESPLRRPERRHPLAHLALHSFRLFVHLLIILSAHLSKEPAQAVCSRVDVNALRAAGFDLSIQATGSSAIAHESARREQNAPCKVHARSPTPPSPSLGSQSSWSRRLGGTSCARRCGRRPWSGSSQA